jgi:hypothetical protein
LFLDDPQGQRIEFAAKRIDKCHSPADTLVKTSVSTWGCIMTTKVAEAIPGRMAKLLAILSVACFWLLPLSPMVAIGAVSMTKGASGWSRSLAVTGAVLCVAYTVVMALLIARLALPIIL